MICVYLRVGRFYVLFVDIMVVIIVFVLGSDSSGMWVVLGSISLVWILLLMM